MDMNVIEKTISAMAKNETEAIVMIKLISNLFEEVHVRLEHITDKEIAGYLSVAVSVGYGILSIVDSENAK